MLDPYPSPADRRFRGLVLGVGLVVGYFLCAIAETALLRSNANSTFSTVGPAAPKGSPASPELAPPPRPLPTQR